MDLASSVTALLLRHPAVHAVHLIGSRARSGATDLSDWDFSVETDDFDTVASALPELVTLLRPLARQWDPLGEHPTYMLMLRGPTKVDLLFLSETFTERPPWQARAETLAAIDAHFWDWILWLAAKRRAGRDELVAAELEKVHGFLLGPLGVRAAPATIEEAVERYLVALEERERELGAKVSRELGEEVRPALSGQGGLGAT